MTDVLVQVAMPATGAGMLTRALTRLRPQLRKHDVAVVTDRQLDRLAQTRAAERSGTSSRLVVSGASLLGASAVGPDDVPQFRPQATGAISRILDTVPADNARIVLYTHRQDRLMELSYLSRVRAGELAEFDAQFPYRFDPVLDYAELVDRLRAIPRVADVVVRPWELAQRGTHALVNDFLALLGLQDQLDLYAIGANLRPYPRRYTAQGAQLALTMNALAETTAERKRIRQFLTANFSAQGSFLIDVLDAANRAKILSCYAESNRALFQRYLPNLPEDSYLDDAATFALGNVLDQPTRRVPPKAARGAGKPTAGAQTRRTKPQAVSLLRSARRRLARDLRRIRQASAGTR